MFTTACLAHLYFVASRSSRCNQLYNLVLDVMDHAAMSFGDSLTPIVLIRVENSQNIPVLQLDASPRCGYTTGVICPSSPSALSKRSRLEPSFLYSGIC